MQTFTYVSSDKTTDIHAYAVLPEGEIRGILQISHGMCEYFGRYLDFAKALNEVGIAVFGNDHLGHGETARNSKEGDKNLGFISARHGADYLVEDVHTLTLLIRERYPELPLVLFGHSMGSFVAREVLARYGNDYTAGIICGTGGPESPAAAGKMVARCVCAVCGPRYRSKLIKSMAFGSYNKAFPKGCDKSAWLTRDEEVVKRYNADPFCNYSFTAAGYADLFTLLAWVSKKEWANRLPKDLPLLVISGGADPVGGNGRGVDTVAHRLTEAGIADLTYQLYPDMRHELLNEIGKEEVVKDILEWTTKRLHLQN